MFPRQWKDEENPEGKNIPKADHMNPLQGFMSTRKETWTKKTM